MSWDYQQLPLKGYLAHRIFRRGATRNLLLHNVKSGISVEMIQNDLDHIHGLEVISVAFIENNTLLSLNSVSHAITARTCMMSRLKYKGLRIDFAPDECDQSLPETYIKPEPVSSASSVRAPVAQNRFQLLKLEESEGGNSSNMDGTNSDDAHSATEAALDWADLPVDS